MSLTSESIEKDKGLISSRLSLLFNHPTEENSSLIPSDSSIILNPSAIWDILILLEQLSITEQTALLTELSSYITKFPLNSLILAKRNSQNEDQNTNLNVLDQFLRLSLQLAEENPIAAQKTTEILLNLYKLNVLEKNHLNIIYSFLSTKFYQQKLTGNLLLFAIKLLYQIFSQNIPNIEDEPLSFFYFGGENSSLQASQQQPILWKFNNGLAFGIWFYLDEVNQSTSKDPKLLTIFCEGYGGVEAYFIEKNLYYRVLFESYNEHKTDKQGIFIGTFETKRWYYVAIEHDREKGVEKAVLKVVVDSEKHKSIELKYPDIKEDVVITKLSVAEGLTGRISSIILFNSYIGEQKLIEMSASIKYGAYNEENLKSSEHFYDKLEDKIMLFYTPVRSDDEMCFDLLNGLRSRFIGNSGASQKHATNLRLKAFGGISSLLPFFYFLRNTDYVSGVNFLGHIETSKHSELLNELLKLITVLFKNFQEAQVEASRIGFFRIISQLLAETFTTSFTAKSLNILIELWGSLTNSRLIDEMFISILWKYDRFLDSRERTREQAIEFLQSIYVRNPAYFSNLYDVQSIIDLMLEKYDPTLKMKTAEYSKPNWRSSSTPEHVQAERDLNPLFKIVEIILLSDTEATSMGFLAIINALNLNCSSYFHLLLLRMLRNVLIKMQDAQSSDTGNSFKVLIDHKAALHILHLMNQTECLDLKATCIQLLNILLTHSNNNDKEELTQCISSIVWKFSTTHDQEMDFDKLFSNSQAIKETTESSEPFSLAKAPKNFSKSSKISLPNLASEPDFSKSATSSLHSALQSELVLTDTDKKLAEMSLNLRNSIPKERLGESDSFRKNKTFDFSRGNKLAPDVELPKNNFAFPNSLSQTSDLRPSYQSEEFTLDAPSFKLKKKPQASSSSAQDRGTRKKPNLSLGIEEQDSPPKNVESEIQRSLNVSGEQSIKVKETTRPEIENSSIQTSLEKGSSKLDAFKKRKRNLGIISELDNEGQSDIVDSLKGLKLSLNTGGSISDKTEELRNRAFDEDKTSLNEEQKEIPKERATEPRIELGSKAKGKGLAFGKKKPIFSSTPLLLDVDAINQEFTFGGEKGQRMLDDTDMTNIMDIVVKEVYRLAQECVDHMKTKEVEEKKKAEAEVEVEEGFKPPKNMPQSVRGLKKIDFFGAKTGKPTLELGNDALKSSVSSNDESHISKPMGFKPTLNTIKESTFVNISEHSEEASVASSMDQLSPRQIEMLIHKTPKMATLDLPKQTKNDVIIEQPDGFIYQDIYCALMDWLLGKEPNTSLSSSTIEDSDKIKCAEVILAIIKFFEYTSEIQKQKILQDIFTLLRGNSYNCDAILKIQEFHSFILDVLYDYQIQLFSNELERISQRLWELGRKIHTVLLKYALSQKPEGYKYLDNLFKWAYDKETNALTKPNPTKYEKGAHYLLRYLWLGFLESLAELRTGAKSLADSEFWRNIHHTVYYTIEVIVSTFSHNSDEALVQSSDETSKLINLVSKLQPGEDFPYNFKAIFAQSYWVDWKLIETLMKILDPLWALSSNLKASSKPFQNTMNEDTSERLKFLLSRSNFSNFEGNEYLLKHILELLICCIDDHVDNSKQVGVELGCKRLEKLIAFILTASSQQAQSSISIQDFDFLVSTVLFVLKFLYQMFEKSQLSNNEDMSLSICTCLLKILQNMQASMELRQNRNQDEIASMSSSTRHLKQIIGGRNISNTVFEALELDTTNLSELQNIVNKTSSREKLETFDNWFQNILSDKVSLLLEKHFDTNWAKISLNLQKKFGSKISKLNQEALDIDKVREEAKEKSKEDIFVIIGKVNTAEKQRKTGIIELQDENSKIIKSLWNKIWEKLRTCRGQWKHSELYDQTDTKDNRGLGKNNEKMKFVENKLFVHKLAKFETKSRSRPFVKTKPLDPKYAEGYELELQRKGAEDKKSRIAFIEDLHDIKAEIIEGTRKEISAEKYITNKEEIEKSKRITFLNLKENPGIISNNSNDCNSNSVNIHGFLIKNDTGAGRFRTCKISPNIKAEYSNKEEVFINTKCQWVNALRIQNGWLGITSNRLIFIREKSNQSQAGFQFGGSNNIHPYKKASKEWSLDFIKGIHKKRFFTKKTGLEIELIDGTTLFFNFLEGELEEVSQKLVRMRKTRCPNLTYYGSLDPRKVLEKTNITKKWLNYELTNFDYLMWLNVLGGRSYNDLTQYPVFPWIISDFKSSSLNLLNYESYRDLSRPKESIALVDQASTESAINKIDDKKNNSIQEVPNIRFESQVQNSYTCFCTPATILVYLNQLLLSSREQIQLYNDLTSSKTIKIFDNIEQFYSETAEEIIPEFFFLPDFLKRDNRIENTKNINLPDWCSGSPYKFVALLREALESDSVSQALHNWIDLAFGFKQDVKQIYKGEIVDLNNQMNNSYTQVWKNNYIANFGQLPIQLFAKTHPRRKAFEDVKFVMDPTADVRVYRPPGKKKISESGNSSEGYIKALRDLHWLGNNSLLKMKVINDSRLIGLRKDGRITYFKWWSTVPGLGQTAGPPFKCGVEKEKVVHLNKGRNEWLCNFDYSVKYISYPIVFLNMGKIIAAGGYWDGRLSLFSVDNDSLIEAYIYHADTITAIANDRKENFLITGSKSGECIVWRISPELTKLTARFHFHDHTSMITHISIANELRLFATSSNDGTINVYHSILGQLFRTIQHPDRLPIQTVLISSCPLPSIIFSSEKNQRIYSYSINGDALEDMCTNCQYITSPMLVKDLHSSELLVYGTEKGELCIRKLPFLEDMKKWDVSLNCPVVTIQVSKDKKYIFCGCSDGEFSVLTDPSFSGPNQ